MTFKILPTLKHLFHINLVMLNICAASESDIDEMCKAEATLTNPINSQARFIADNISDEEGETIDTATEIAQPTLYNNTFAHHIPTTQPAIETESNACDSEEDGFISVAKQAKLTPTFRITGGMFDTLTLPKSTMPYTEIELSHCTCFYPLDPASFQNNPDLTRVVLNSSQLNLRYFEEKLGESCPRLFHIDLQGFVDVSQTDQPLITPERFAQIAHPDLLQRILGGNCIVHISIPGQTACYQLDDMKERFLTSILHLRSLTKAKETVTTYQVLIDMITAGASKLDPAQLAAAGGKALFNAYTGL